MRYILENPSFTNNPIEINTYEVVQRINEYINKPIRLGDKIILLVSNTHIKLQLISIDKHVCYFKNVKQGGLI